MTVSRENEMSEVVEAVSVHCSEDCEYRWGRNCAAHWLDIEYDRIVNDVDELNRLADAPSAVIFYYDDEDCRLYYYEGFENTRCLILEVDSKKYLITSLDDLEFDLTSHDWGPRYFHTPRIEFKRR